jgi:hypothetical protein
MLIGSPSTMRRWCAPLTAALVVVSCGGGSATAPTPAPTPIPTPEPTPEPTPVTSCSPLPPPISRFKVKIQSKDRHFWDIDATPLVGPNGDYCASIGFTDGRTICPVRPEGDPLREECELYAVGIAEDTGQPGPTWTRDGEFCMGQKTDSQCEHEPNNVFQLRIYMGGTIKACAENKACGETFADLKL